MKTLVVRLGNNYAVNTCRVESIEPYVPSRSSLLRKWFELPPSGPRGLIMACPSLLQLVYGNTTHSNNNNWLRRKLFEGESGLRRC